MENNEHSFLLHREYISTDRYRKDLHVRSHTWKFVEIMDAYGVYNL